MKREALAETRFASMKLPAQVHPISRLANFDLVLLHREFLCAFRPPKESLSSAKEAARVGRVLESPWMLEVLWGGLGEALRRCAEWHADCEVAVPVSSDGRGWALLASVRHSDSLQIPREELALKIDCVAGEVLDSESPGLYVLEDTFASKVYDHMVLNLTTSLATMEHIRQLVQKHQGRTLRDSLQ